MESILSDVRSALRALRRNPRLTIAALLTLVLGIGANTAIFSVVNGVLLRPLPYPDADRLVKITGAERDGPLRYRNISRPDFLDFQKDATSFEAMGAHGAGIGNATLTPGASAGYHGQRGVLRGPGCGPCHGTPVYTGRNEQQRATESCDCELRVLARPDGGQPRHHRPNGCRGASPRLPTPTAGRAG
jgi:hypothetical protein